MDEIKELLIKLTEGQTEIQQAHFEQNSRNHEEIVEMHSGKIDNHERAIKKLNIVK